MTTLPDAALQRAFYSTLTSDTDLMGDITGVYDDVPEDVLRPYLVVGDMLTTPDNRHGEFCFQTVVTVHVWSEYRGNAEALGLINQVVALFDHKPLVVNGFRHVATRYEFSQVLKDPGALELRHAPVRFRVLTELVP